MSEQERFAALKQQAREGGDLDLYTFYAGLEHELELLRAVGTASACVYQDSSNGDAWNTLFEALFDAGLLTTGETESEAAS